MSGHLELQNLPWGLQEVMEGLSGMGGGHKDDSHLTDKKQQPKGERIDPPHPGCDPCQVPHPSSLTYTVNPTHCCPGPANPFPKQPPVPGK